MESDFKMPKVSVIIPAYNAEAFLSEAIESVLAQSFQDFEVIVIDDGSTDDSARIANSFGGNVFCLSQENRGLAAARNRGIAESKGELIALLDADDYWLAEKLEKQVELLERESEAVACFTLTENFNDQGETLETSVEPDYADIVEALLLYSCIIGPPSSVMIKRSALNKIGDFDMNFSQCADWDMWLRLAELGKVVYVNKPLVRYRIHPTNMSKNTPLLESDTFGVLDKFFSDPAHFKFEPLKNNCYSNHWMIIAGCYLQAGQLAESLRCLWTGVRLYPKNIVRPLSLPLRFTKRLLEINA